MSGDVKQLKAIQASFESLAKIQMLSAAVGEGIERKIEDALEKAMVQHLTSKL